MKVDKEALHHVLAMKEKRQKDAVSRRALAAKQYWNAARTAHNHGLILTKHNDSHYSLEPAVKCKDLRWRQNIYPGNLRLYYDRNLPTRPPFLKLPEEWTLGDILELTIGAMP